MITDHNPRHGAIVCAVLAVVSVVMIATEPWPEKICFAFVLFVVTAFGAAMLRASREVS